MLAVGDSCTVDIEVAYCGSVDYPKESAVKFVGLIAVGDSVSLTVKDTTERCIFVAYHKVRIIALSQVYVSRQ